MIFNKGVNMIEDEILILRKPEKKDANQIMAFRQAFLDKGETIYGGGGLEKFEKYEDWLNNNKTYEENPPEGRVKGTQFISVRKSDGKIVGMSNIRHHLNEFLLQHGGHIGYCILPEERGKGYSTRQCALSLNFLKTLGVNRVLITCDKNNLASAKTIINNGGVLENEFNEDGVIVQRYWIDN